jgi:hypothetical protein
MTHLIVASAAPFETLPLMEKLATAGIRATQITVGVGAVSSAICAGRLLDVVAGRDVMFCCTGGVLGTFKDVHVYQARSVKFSPPDVRRSQSYLVADSEPELFPHSVPSTLSPCTVAGSSTISLVEEQSSGPQPVLETLELYSVAKAWHSVAKTFTGLVAVTNQVGPNAHRQWLAQHRLAATLTAEAAMKILEPLRHQWS